MTYDLRRLHRRGLIARIQGTHRAQAGKGSRARRLLILRVEPHGGQVLVEVDQAVVIRVSDSGGGIDPSLGARVLEPYVSTKNERGSGLGLSIVASIVTAHGGAVCLEDNPGGGSLFRVELPLAPATG